MCPVPFNSARAFVALGSWLVEGTNYVCRQGLLRNGPPKNSGGSGNRGRISSGAPFYNGRHVTPRGCCCSVKQDHQFLNKISTRKKDRTSSILTFSNRSFKLFTLKNRLLMTAKVLHLMRMYLMVQGVWQAKHCVCGSCFSMKEWVSLVWPMCNRNIMTCSLLDFPNAGLYSPRVGWIWKSLL